MPENPHPVFVWAPHGGAIVHPKVAEFCKRMNMTVDKAFGETGELESEPEDEQEEPLATADQAWVVTPPANTDFPEPTEEEDTFPVHEEDDDTINFFSEPESRRYFD